MNFKYCVNSISILWVKKKMHSDDIFFKMDEKGIPGVFL